MTTKELLQNAKAAAPALLVTDTQQKNRALLAMAEALETESDAILQANVLDLEAAREHIAPVMLDRLENMNSHSYGKINHIR